MKKTLNAIYGFKFFDDFILIYPLYAVMFTDAGMQPWQLAALLMVWSATSIVLEIPSGAWADKCYWAHYWEKKKLGFYYFLTFFNGLLLMLAAWLFNGAGLILLILFSFLFSILQVLLEGQLHHAVPSDIRATVASVSGFMIEMVVLVSFFGFGLIAQVHGYQKAFLVFGSFIAVIGLIYLVFSSWKKSPDKAGRKRTAR